MPEGRSPKWTVRVDGGNDWRVSFLHDSFSSTSNSTSSGWVVPWIAASIAPRACGCGVAARIVKSVSRIDMDFLSTGAETRAEDQRVVAGADGASVRGVSARATRVG